MFDRLKKRLAGDTPAWADDEFEDNSVVVPTQRPQRRRARGQDSAAQEAMDYLKQYEGEYISNEDIAIELGVTGGYVSLILTRLIEDGAITRRGKRGKYTYKVNRKHPTKGAPRGRAVTKSANAKKRVQELRETVAKQDLAKDDPRYTRILSVLRQHQQDFISQAEIAERAHVSPGSVGSLILKLEEQGKITRSLPVPKIGTRYAVNDSQAKVGPNHEAVNLPSERVPVRTESYDESLIREFLAWRKNKQG